LLLQAEDLGRFQQQWADNAAESDDRTELQLAGRSNRRTGPIAIGHARQLHLDVTIVDDLEDGFLYAA